MIAGPVASLTAALVLAAGAITLPGDGGGCWDHAPRCDALVHLRHQAGLLGLDQQRDLQDVAEAWAEHMAATGILEHSGTPGLSECVGYGEDWRTVFAMFMDSPRHREIILDPGNRRVGIGAQRDAERVWITLVFE